MLYFQVPTIQEMSYIKGLLTPQLNIITNNFTMANK